MDGMSRNSLRDQWLQLADRAVSVLLGGIVGVGLSIAYLHLAEPALTLGGLTVCGPDSRLTIRPDEFAIYGADYAIVRLYTRRVDGRARTVLEIQPGEHGFPILEILDDEGEIRYSSPSE
jgi:hypothetical protein